MRPTRTPSRGSRDRPRQSNHASVTTVGILTGLMFLLIGVLWMIQAFAERAINNLWWLTLISCILMIVLAFWVSGQFFLVRAYTLLIFAGIWAMTNGIIAVIPAFQIRELGQAVNRVPR